MGTMTFLEMRDEVAGTLHRTSTSIGEARVDRWVRNTVFEILGAFKFREMETAISQDLQDGTNVIPLPADFRFGHELGSWVYRLTGESIGKILPETREQYLLHQTASPPPTGIPLYYHIFADNYYVRPVADDDYTILFHYWRKFVFDPTSISPLKDEWDDIICVGAAAKGFRFFGMQAEMINAKNEFVGLIRSRVMEEDIEEFPTGSIDPYPRSEEELRTGIR